MPRRLQSHPLLLLFLASSVAAQGPINPSILAPQKLTAEQEALRRSAVDQAVTQARAAVVHVMVWVAQNPPFKKERPSSGVLVDPTGLVVTHWDLVSDAFDVEGKPVDKHSLKVKLRSGDVFPATLVAKHLATGLALLKVEAEGRVFYSADLADAARVVPGEPVATLSFAHGKENQAFGGALVRACGGTVVGDPKPSKLSAKQILLTDATIIRESHGAAMLDANGRLLGIINASHVGRDLQEPTLEDLMKPSFGFAVQSDTIRKAFRSAFRKHKATAAENEVRWRGAANAIQKVRKSIVAVWGGEGRRPPLGDMDPYASGRHEGLGSGVIIDSTGLVLTNAHLVKRDDATVTLVNGKSFKAKVLARRKSASMNVALLKMKLGGTRVHPIELGDSSKVIPGEAVIGIGQPYGNGVLTLSVGVLSASRATPRVHLGAQHESGAWLQSDATLDDRNGGGALVDCAGRLIGIVNGGIVDKRKVAAVESKIRKEVSKLETGLHFVPGVNLIRRSFRTLLDEHAGSNGTVAEPAVASDADMAVRRSPVTRMLEKHANCALNVYVAWSSKKRDIEDNPFAVSKPRIITRSLGSGVIITRDGLAITNWHVVDDATYPTGAMRQDAAVYVRGRDGRRWDAEVLSISREDDLALIRLKLEDGETVDPIVLGDSDSLREGETVIAIGNPNGQKNTATVGVVTAKNQAINIKGRWAKFKGLIQTDAAINGGNSGGGLLDINGRLVGINSAGGRGRRTTSYAIPVNYVREKLRGVLLSPKKLRSIYTGMTWGDQDGHPQVVAVSRFGPARRAGIETGDLLLALDGKPLTWSVGLTMELLKRTADQPLRFKIRRQDKDGPEIRTIKLAPWSAATHAVYEQTTLWCAVLPFRAKADVVRKAWTLKQKKWDGGEPLAIPESLVRVVELGPGDVRESGVRAGDLLLGVELSGRTGTATARTMAEFRTVKDIQVFVNSHSNYDGVPFSWWVYREGKIQVLKITATRLFY